MQECEKGPRIVTITELFGVLANPMSEFLDSLQLASKAENGKLTARIRSEAKAWRQKDCEQEVAKETKNFQKVFSPSLSSFASVRNPFGPAAMPVIALVIAPSPDKIARRVRGKFSNKKYQWKTSVAPAYEIGLIDDVVAWMR